MDLRFGNYMKVNPDALVMDASDIKLAYDMSEAFAKQLRSMMIADRAIRPDSDRDGAAEIHLNVGLTDLYRNIEANGGGEFFNAPAIDAMWMTVPPYPNTWLIPNDTVRKYFIKILGNDDNSAKLHLEIWIKPFHDFGDCSFCVASMDIQVYCVDGDQPLSSIEDYPTPFRVVKDYRVMSVATRHKKQIRPNYLDFWKALAKKVREDWTPGPWEDFQKNQVTAALVTMSLVNYSMMQGWTPDGLKPVKVKKKPGRKPKKALPVVEETAMSGVTPPKVKVINTSGSHTVRPRYYAAEKGTGYFSERHYTVDKWQVRGHVRHYKSGKTVYIKPRVNKRKAMVPSNGEAANPKIVVK